MVRGGQIGPSPSRGLLVNAYTGVRVVVAAAFELGIEVEQIGDHWRQILEPRPRPGLR